MNKELIVLCMTALSIGIIHTVLGPDHYLPFIVMSRARKWSMVKTAVVTAICGIGHILSSVVIGAVGIVVGIQVMKLEFLEAFRGNLAAWALIGFGLAYFIWGIRRALKNKPHKHIHVHKDLTKHVHTHTHADEHIHVHESATKKTITPWVLFTIFVLGPCEPLIPVLMYPAAENSMVGVAWVAAVFGGATILTMMCIVMVSSWGINLLPLGRLERYTHALAGLTICASGLAIQCLGL